MVMLQRENIDRKLIIPLFGSFIQVKETEADWVISGFQWNGEPEPKPLPAYDDLADPECRVGDLLLGFDEDRRLKQAKRSKAPHFLFANANNLPKQKEFVRTFGPVLARKIDRTTSCKDLPTITALQNKAILRFEQHVYSLIFGLTELVNDLIPFSRKAFKAVKPEMRAVLVEHPDRYSARHGILDYEIRETRKKAREVDSYLIRHNILTRDVKGKLDKLRELVSKISESVDPSPKDDREETRDNPPSWWNPSGWQYYTQTALSKTSSLDLIDRANQLLCDVFNRFPFILCCAEGVAQEMPYTNSLGILPALYYMLRLEYLYEREVRRCANPKCGEYFVPGSKSRTHCSDLCSGNAESQRYRYKEKFKCAALSRWATKKKINISFAKSKSGNLKGIYILPEDLEKAGIQAPSDPARFIAASDLSELWVLQ